MLKQTQRIIIASIAFMTFLMSSNVWAMSLYDAKAQGYVGERQNGYLGIVVAAPPSEVPPMVNDVNSRRRGEYQRIANQRGVPISEVERLAGAQAIEQTPPGQYIEINGQWIRK